MTKREKFPTRTIRLVGDQQLATALALLPHVPLDAAKPLELIIREEAKPRKLDQNALMWVGPLADIAAQAYVEGRTYSAEVWHEHLKELYLPEEFDPELTKDGYQKWDYTPAGKRILVGSTTQLTVKGFAQYLTQVEAFGASLGVLWSPRRSDRMAA
ncbi:MAG: recombination protein NinB [Patescibacteria group bacterium]|nr:recombination protein NinB [Patescibacteria group bacterium]